MRIFGIERRYESFETEDNERVEIGVFVRYAREWDGYGAMPGAATVDSLDAFVAAAGEKVRDLDRRSTYDK